MITFKANIPKREDPLREQSTKENSKNQNNDTSKINICSSKIHLFYRHKEG